MLSKSPITTKWYSDVSNGNSLLPQVFNYAGVGIIDIGSCHENVNLLNVKVNEGCSIDY